MDLLAVGCQLEGQFRPDEGDAQEFLDDGPQFRIVGLEEFAACGNVEEEVAHSEMGAGRGGDGLDFRRIRTGDFDHRADLVFGAAGAEGYLRHSGDRRQRLAAETVGLDFLEIFGGRNLAGGVPLKTEHGIVGRHAASVVDDLDQRLSGIKYRHDNAGRAGIYGVLHQLFHDGGRP